MKCRKLYDEVIIAFTIKNSCKLDHKDMFRSYTKYPTEQMEQALEKTAAIWWEASDNFKILMDDLKTKKKKRCKKLHIRFKGK